MDFPDPVTLVVIGASVNLLAFIFFTVDKYQAKIRGWRIPETPLLLLAAIGPFGALMVMMVFRHKTRHAKFFLVPVFALLHLLLVIWFWAWIIG